MLTITNTLLAVLVASFAIFMNYPSPPESPLLYQWRTIGSSYHHHKEFKIFVKDEIGNGSAGTVVCLHGFPTSSFDWFKVWPGLKRHFSRIIALDFLGFGFSDKPRHHDYSIHEQADIVLSILKKLNLKNIHLLAHDYGDTVALEMLARQMDNPQEATLHINTVCLLNGGLFVDKHHPTLLQKLLRAPVVGTIISRFANYKMFEIGLSGIFAASKQPSIAELSDMWHLARLQDGYRVLGRLLSYIDERIQKETRWVGALQKTTVNVHMIYGTEDPVNPPPFAQHYREMVPKPSIEELRTVGHYVQLEAPEEMLSSYISFLLSLKMQK